MVFIGADIYSSKQIKPSHIINSVAVGASFTGIGSIFSAAWFIADFGTMGVNYILGNGAKGLGDMIDEKYGPVYEFNEN
ncbi:MAG: hypothetical protein AAFX55_01990 [Bacteroidota bacterium]